MSKFSIFSVVVLFGVLSSAQGLSCNEGFNMSMSGIPFYHWKERTCAANSKCFGQELSANLGAKVVLRYGACISSTYASLLDCNSLFGPDSTLDPADLLNLVPDMVQQINAAVADFVTGGVNEIITLLSAGSGMQEFVSGIYTFYESMGFNMEKARPLETPLANLLLASFKGNQSVIIQEIQNFYTAFGKLDTVNTKLSNDIYKFMGNFFTATQIETRFKGDPMLKAYIERGPGLLKSMIPASWQPSDWYDVLFDIMADVNISDWKTTTQDVINTIKSAATIPAEVSEILDPIFNSLPEMVGQVAAGNHTYPGYWSLQLLKHFSEKNAATQEFSTALITFIQTLTTQPLQAEFKTTIEYMPGLFYKFFPADKAKIEDVYRKMAAGFNSFDFANMSNTADATKLSDFTLDLAKKITGAPLNATYRAFVINFSAMFYNLMSDYTTELDKFFQVLIDGFASFPTIDSGAIIKNLITEMGGQVPPEVDPLLTNLQGVINGATANPLNITNLYTSFNTIISAYKSAYPASPFPDLFTKYLDIMKKITSLPLNDPNYMQKIIEFQMELTYWQIDVSFAMFNAFNYSNDQMTQNLIKAFPAFGTYIRFVQSLEADDVKQLIKDILNWAMTTGQQLTTEGFVAAIQPTVRKITAKMTSVLKEIRYLFSPSSCKFGACDTDLCNNHKYIADQDPVTKATTTTTRATTAAPTTTSGGEKGSFSIALNIATMWMACKAFFG